MGCYTCFILSRVASPSTAGSITYLAGKCTCRHTYAYVTIKKEMAYIYIYLLHREMAPFCTVPFRVKPPATTLMHGKRQWDQRAILGTAGKWHRKEREGGRDARCIRSLCSDSPAVRMFVKQCLPKSRGLGPPRPWNLKSLRSPVDMCIVWIDVNRWTY